MESWKELLQLIATELVDLIRSEEIITFNNNLWELCRSTCNDIILLLRDIIDLWVN